MSGSWQAARVSILNRGSLGVFVFAEFPLALFSRAARSHLLDVLLLRRLSIYIVDQPFETAAVFEVVCPHRVVVGLRANIMEDNYHVRFDGDAAVVAARE